MLAEAKIMLRVMLSINLYSLNLQLIFLPLCIRQYSALSVTHFGTNNSLSSQKQSFASLLHCCSSHPNQLKQIHALLLTTGLSIKNSLITQLLTSLTLLGDMAYARRLFDEMHKPRSFLWNTLIKGYVKNELFHDAVALYGQMHRISVRPDQFTFPFVLKGCAGLVDQSCGAEVHAHVVKSGVDFDAIVRTELMIMYAKFEDLDSADYLFESMHERDLVAWNALMSVYTQNGHADRALALFRQMGFLRIKPDSVTLVSALSACAQLGCLEAGKEIDQLVVEEGLESNVVVNNARLDMYAKCGNMEFCRNLFDKMPKRNVISWSTVIGGYAINGDSENALGLFSQMQDDRVEPNHVTFLGVLSACSHAGLVTQGKNYFHSMTSSNNYDIQPRIEHYACMVDLLGRSGHLEEAYNFIRRMHIEPDAGVWGALLGACTVYQNIELGQQVADVLFGLASDSGSYHVLLSNIYAAAGRWDDVKNVRQRMKREGVKKVAGYSSVESNGEIHIFHGGDRSHTLSESIYRELEDLIKQMRSTGYVPRTSVVLHDVDMEEKESALSTHSEKLAIAFGLISVRPNFPIRVIKNLRVCGDCHNFCKFVSKMKRREIIMRDKNRFHRFKDGVCSCKDFW